jgi:hypothetical protein
MCVCLCRGYVCTCGILERTGLSDGVWVVVTLIVCVYVCVCVWVGFIKYC